MLSESDPLVLEFKLRDMIMAPNTEYVVIHSATLRHQTSWSPAAVECDLVTIGEKSWGLCNLLKSALRSFCDAHKITTTADAIRITQSLVPDGVRVDISIPKCAEEFSFSDDEIGLAHISALFDKHIMYITSLHVTTDSQAREEACERIPIRTRPSLARYHARFEQSFRVLAGSKIDILDQSVVVPIQIRNSAPVERNCYFDTDGEVDGLITRVSNSRVLTLETGRRTIEIFFSDDLWHLACTLLREEERCIVQIRGVSRWPDTAVIDAHDLQLVGLRAAPKTGPLFSEP